MIRFLPALICACCIFFIPLEVSAQSSQAKYGNDFLSVGGGARALGMGGAHVALSDDVTSGFWNPAGLQSVSAPQIIYMHAERFNGIVGFDYGAAAIPLKNREGVLGISFIRQGVDNIANTLNAWDDERNLPKENVNDYITKFSAADYAFYLSYAQSWSEQLQLGGSLKIIHHKLGPFATAWGYSLDAGVILETSIARFGASVRDLTTMRKMWSVDQSQFENVDTQFEDLGAIIPSGQNEYVLPSVKLGIARTFTHNDFDIQAALDADLLFENRRAYYWNIGGMSIEPHVGTEVSYKKIVSLRMGLTDFIDDPVSGFSVSPTLGTGIKVSSFMIDYAFASFSGVNSDLGYTHRISLRYDFN